MKRGDLVTVALQGAQGKPRPALVIQSDFFAGTTSITVLPVTSTLVDAPLMRIPLEPSEANNLRKPSQIMVDKPVTVPRDKVGPAFGRITPAEMEQVTRTIAVFLGLSG